MEVDHSWQHQIPPALREYLISKVLLAIFPDNNDVPEDPIQRLEIYNDAAEIERQTFNAANSREHYYELLAERIYRITRDIERAGGARR